MKGRGDRGPTGSASVGWICRQWRLLLGLALSVICIYLAVRGVSLQALRAALAAAQWQWLLPAVAVVLASTVVKALRWQAMFYPQVPRLTRVWSVFLIGQMLNAVLPARAGELGRIYFIGEGEDVSRAKALSTIVIEKMVDLVMLTLCYLIVALWLATAPVGLPGWLRQVGTSLLPLALAALGGLLLFTYAGRPMWRLVRRLLSPLPLRWQDAIDRAAKQALTAFAALKHWQTSLTIWSLSLIIWAFSALTNVLVFRAFQLPLSVFVALFLLVVLMSGVAVPPLPGNLGVFPYLSQLVLSLFGVSRETALVYGIVLQVVAYLPLIILGTGCLLWENWKRHSDGALSPPDAAKSNQENLVQASVDRQPPP